jgi:hypothetical protein
MYLEANKKFIIVFEADNPLQKIPRLKGDFLL